MPTAIGASHVEASSTNHRFAALDAPSDDEPAVGTAVIGIPKYRTPLPTGLAADDIDVETELPPYLALPEGWQLLIALARENAWYDHPGDLTARQHRWMASAMG